MHLSFRNLSNTIALSLWFFITGCGGHQDNLMKINGIWLETFPPENQDENRYTADNKIFAAGREFTYRYHYISPKGDTLLFKITESETPEFLVYQMAWDYVDPDTADQNTVKIVSFRIVEGREPFVLNAPDFNQTVQEIRLFNPDQEELGGFTSSSLIENDKNVWMQMPNIKMFRILALNPMPFIQAPYQKGNAWEWQMEVAETNGDSRWKAWGGLVKNTMHYQIGNQEMVRVPWGEALCHLVDADAESGLGRTHLKAAFNETYGFLRLDYTNIDGSKLVFELTGITGGAATIPQ